MVASIRLRYIVIASMAIVGPLLTFANIPGSLFFTIFGLVLVAFLLATMPESYIAAGFFVFLPFEGMLKILSNFNPLVHVGSDLILILVLIRLMARKVREPEIGPGLESSKYLTSVLSMLIIYWIWVGIQFINPWGLGIIPSLAALKIHVMPYLQFFFVGFLMKDEEIRQLPRVVTYVGAFTTTIAAIDGVLGDQFLPSLHPRYQALLSNQFTGVLYRPFGTTSVAGGPANWAVHFTPAVLLMTHQYSEIKNLSKWHKVAANYFLIVSVAVVLMCQGRTSFMQFCAIVLIGSFVVGRKAFKTGLKQLLIIACLGSLFFSYSDEIDMGNLDPERITTIADRFLTLTETKTLTESREGGLDRMLNLSEKTTMGIGLSRVGAAAVVFKSKIIGDSHFGFGWSFADNVYLSQFVELGIGGLVSWIFIYLMVLKNLTQINSPGSRIMQIWVLMYFVSGLGSEGILYSPAAPYLWLNLTYIFRLHAGDKVKI